jgi:hypothetical protein
VQVLLSPPQIPQSSISALELHILSQPPSTASPPQTPAQSSFVFDCGSTAVEDCAGVCGGDAVLGGCDNICNSSAEIDDCGICGGDNSTCTSFSEPPNWDCILGESVNGTGVLDNVFDYQNNGSITSVVSFNDQTHYLKHQFH